MRRVIRFRPGGSVFAGAGQEAIMQTGLLWFDNDPNREMARKIEDAARRYKERFGVAPNICYVNQAALGEGELRLALQGNQAALLRVVPASNVLLHHFWVGVEEQKEVFQGRGE
jgi:alkyl sulfatase BDS1-like metallo-beta-lactamase superfamily hydrolase